MAPSSFPLILISICLCYVHTVQCAEDLHDSNGILLDPYHEILHVLNITEDEFTVTKFGDVLEHFTERFKCGDHNESIVSQKTSKDHYCRKVCTVYKCYLNTQGLHELFCFVRSFVRSCNGACERACFSLTADHQL